MAKRVVLAYSGGLDTSVAVRWIAEEWGVEVDRARRRRRPERRRRLGRRSASVRSRPARSRRWSSTLAPSSRDEYCLPALRGERALRGQVPAGVGAVAPGDRQAPRRRGAGARRRRGRARLHGQGQRPGALRGVDARARARPRRARARAGVGLHPRGLDRVRGRRTTSRSRSRKDNPYSIDENLWGRAIECGVIEDPWVAPPEEPYALTRRSGAGAARPVGDRRALRARACRSRSTATRRCRCTSSSREVTAVGRRLRLGPHRHGREPPRRHQEPRGLRVPGRARADPRPRRPRVDHPGARPDAREGAPRAAVRGARVRRPVVLAAARARSTRSSTSSQSHVTGDVRLRLEPGRCFVVGRRADARPLRLRARDLRRRRRVPPRGRRRASCASGVSALETMARKQGGLDA